MGPRRPLFGTRDSGRTLGCSAASVSSASGRARKAASAARVLPSRPLEADFRQRFRRVLGAARSGAERDGAVPLRFFVSFMAVGVVMLS